jgi:hypothetical protein
MQQLSPQHGAMAIKAQNKVLKIRHASTPSPPAGAPIEVVSPRAMRELHVFIDNPLAKFTNEQVLNWLDSLRLDAYMEMNKVIRHCENNVLTGKTICKWTDGILQNAYMVQDVHLRKQLLDARDAMMANSAVIRAPPTDLKTNWVSDAKIHRDLQIFNKVAAFPPIPGVVPDVGEIEDPIETAFKRHLTLDSPEKSPLSRFKVSRKVLRIPFYAYPGKDKKDLHDMGMFETKIKSDTTVARLEWIAFALLGMEEELQSPQLKCPFRLRSKTSVEKGEDESDYLPDFIISNFVPEVYRDLCLVQR